MADTDARHSTRPPSAERPLGTVARLRQWLAQERVFRLIPFVLVEGLFILIILIPFVLTIYISLLTLARQPAVRAGDVHRPRAITSR